MSIIIIIILIPYLANRPQSTRTFYGAWPPSRVPHSVCAYAHCGPPRGLSQKICLKRFLGLLLPSASVGTGVATGILPFGSSRHLSPNPDGTLGALGVSPRQDPLVGDRSVTPTFGSPWVILYSPVPVRASPYPPPGEALDGSEGSAHLSWPIGPYAGCGPPPGSHSLCVRSWRARFT